MACGCWPAKVEVIEGTELYTPNMNISVFDIKWFVVMEPAALVCRVATFISPVHASCLCGRVCIAATAGPQMPLLQGAASCAFFNLPEVWVTKLCAELEVDVPAGSGLLEKLSLLINLLLKPSESELFEILASRTLPKPGAHLLQVFENNEILQEFSEEDQADLTKHLEQTADNSEERAFKDDLKKLGSAIAAKGPKVRSAKAKAKSGAKPPIDEQLWTEEMARSLMPPGFKIFKDYFNSRWLATRKSLESRSRSWACHGQLNSMSQCILWAWQRHQQLYGGAGCPYEWVVEQASGK